MNLEVKDMGAPVPMGEAMLRDADSLQLLTNVWVEPVLGRQGARQRIRTSRGALIGADNDARQLPHSWKEAPSRAPLKKLTTVFKANAHRRAHDKHDLLLPAWTREGVRVALGQTLANISERTGSARRP